MFDLQQWTCFAVFFAILPFVAKCQQQPLPTSVSSSPTPITLSKKPATTTTSDASSTCGLNGNTDTICSPKAGDVWKNGTWYPITWNTMYPTYVSSSTLDIYIYFVQNYQNVLIKKISDTSTSKGNVALLVDDTWRIDPSAQTYECLIYILPSGISPEKELTNRYSDYPPPVHNLVEQSALILPTTASSTSSSSFAVPTSNATSLPANATMPSHSLPLSPPSSPTLAPSMPITPTNREIAANEANSKKETGPESHTIQPWIIAAVVLACLAVLGACLAIFWVMRHSRRRKLVYGEKGHLELNSTASSSMFPVLQQDGSSKDRLNAMSTVSLNQPTINTIVTTTPVRFYGTAHTGSERGSLRSHTAPSSPLINTHHSTAAIAGTVATSASANMGGFISTPSLPLDGKIYMLGDGTRPQSTASFSNISSRSEPPLTSTDALLIADTFRQRMRRPEWQQQQLQQHNDMGNDNHSEGEEAEEEDKRRHRSEELLKKELEAEGTLMKKVGKRAHLLAATYQQRQT